MSATGRAARGLLLACHPLPCVAVAGFAAGFAAVRQAPAGVLVGIAAAIFSGQLVVGWTNDAVDATRDAAAGRLDKPVPAGLVSRRTVLSAAGVAGVVCVVLSLRLGLLAGGLHLVAVASAESYNLGLKRGPASPLPYLLSFGLLPLIVIAAIRHAGQPVAWPPVPQVLAAALLGAAAHAGNTVGDATADAATGVRGIPQRLGPTGSLRAMGVLVVVAAALLLAYPDGATGVRLVLSRILLAAGALLAVAGAVRRTGVGGGPAAFQLTLAAVALVIVGFLAAA